MRRALLALLVLPTLLACPPAVDDDDATEEPTPEPEPSACEVLDRAPRAWSDGPYGTIRKTLADDFTLDLEDEDDFVFSERWTGCESFVFIPDSLRYSANDPTPLWEREEDLRDLIDRSPHGVHYFFVSYAGSSEDEDAMTKPLRERLDAVLEELAEDDAERAAWFADRLHVVRKRRSSLDNWIEDLSWPWAGSAGAASASTGSSGSAGSAASPTWCATTPPSKAGRGPTTWPTPPTRRSTSTSRRSGRSGWTPRTPRGR